MTKNLASPVGVLIAGGRATRLRPATTAISKHLLPIYDKPMIFYSLSLLMLSGCREVVVVGNSRDLPLFAELLGNGADLGMTFHYAAQDEARGIVDAFLVAARWLDCRRSVVVLGDNLMYANDLSESLRATSVGTHAATVFAYRVQDPRAYGVVEFRDDGKARSIEEKPTVPKSNWAIPGLYFFDETAVDRAKRVMPSARGELEITDLLQSYLTHGELHVEKLGRGVAWFDLGDADNMLQAAVFVHALETRQGQKIASIEEIALAKEWIDAVALEKRIKHQFENSRYGEYLRSLTIKDQ